MAGNNSIRGLETVTFTDNMSFDGTERGGAMSANGELWIGAASAPHVRKGTITGSGGITVTVGEGTINVAGTGGATISSVVTTNATPQFSLVGTVETIDFGITNLLLGSPGSSITNAAGNVGYGLDALPALSSGNNNTAVGYFAGNRLNTASGSTLVGSGAGSRMTNGVNTFIGTNAGALVSTGTLNTSVGSGSYNTGTTGTNNTILGQGAASNYASSESSNIIIGNAGTAAESNAIHIGTQGSSAGQQNTCYIAGITGVTVSNPVIVTLNSSTGQLGNVATGNDGVLITSHTGVPSLLANGTTGQILTATTGAPPSWQAAPAAGIGGSTGATDNRVLRADGTGGATLQNSLVAIDDSGYIIGVAGAFGTPSYTFTGDTNTGMFSPGADNIALMAGGGYNVLGDTTSTNIYRVMRTQGGVAYTYQGTAIDLTVTTSMIMIGVTSTAATRTITLPSAPSYSGTTFIIKDESGGAGTNNISVVVSGGVKTIDGATTFLINTNYGSVTVYYNGTNYFTI